VTASTQKGQRIAIVGSGISGMVSAYLLNDHHDITLFEANDYIGGHTHTVEVPLEGKVYPVDTGFIVFNELRYPNFVRLLNRLGVASQPSSMSFSVQCESTGMEYSATSLNTLFAQRRNLLRPSFYRMLADILRFYRESPELLQSEDDTTTLGEYLERNGYSRPFLDLHILPLGGAIWSTSAEEMFGFPARYFVRFFHQHGFLQIRNRPQWRVIKGGSHRYVEALTGPFRRRIRLSTPVKSVSRGAGGVTVVLDDGRQEHFDAVVLATHSDGALGLLSDPSDREREILGAIHYQANETVLHTDESLLPRRRRAWASWNAHLPAEEAGRVTITYNMNILQSLDSPRTFCVTLNRGDEIDPRAVLKRMVYHHPKYTPEAVSAQRRHSEINGVNRTYYCGAYWGFGFHEDGVNSALAVARKFGLEL
jgi:predicted NAD/FAD-binding protein